MKSNPPSKTGYYVLEGVNALASSFFFVTAMFLLHLEHHFTDLQKLTVGAIHGLLYIPGSWYGGRFAQKYGYFASLRVGFGGMAGGVAMAWAWGSLVGLLVGGVVWTLGMCFTWASLEALVSEREKPAVLANRVGFYNVIWALFGAVGGFASRWVFETFGSSSLYWVPVGLHVAQLILLPFLKRRHDAAFGAAGLADSHGTGTAFASIPRPRYFLKLARLANPLAYMAINTVMVVAPTITQRIGLSSAVGAMWASTWLWSRTAGFLVLWKWHGWHYRFGWFGGAFLALVVGFVGTMLSTALWQFVILQMLLGGAAALIYYAALFYAMDGSDAHGEHGGIHEAFIGAGLCGGPAVSALSLFFMPGQPTGPAWMVSGILGCGLVGVITIWGREKRPPTNGVD